MRELDKLYDPAQVEDKTYDFWMKSGAFVAQRDEEKEPYTIVMPPPNITGQLHMGHAMDNTWQDILIRFKRMQGFEVLWVPGTDHASIATEARIVADMRKNGISKEDIGREKFLERAWAWKEQYGGRIVQQLKKLGTSCDWSRERFTMDEGCSEAVRYVFKKLYDEGLIYRGERIINWCPHCRTSISDAEVEHEEQQGTLWHIRYPMAEGDGFLEVATTRPETMLGDVALAVNPEDERYSAFVGKEAILPLVNKRIPVVADSYVDVDFGTGVVKITPAHDPNDFELGRRHNLPIVKILTEDAHINEAGGIYAGLERYEARKAVLKDLQEQGLLLESEANPHNVGTCYRCGTTIEPMVSMQWFVRMDSLAKPAIEAVKDGSIKFMPERFTKTYLHWMENTCDWTISRQLWWGHQIPAWYCDSCGKISVSESDVSVCEHCQSDKVHRDPDTLDTWFSSALWPFSVLGWPQKTADYDYFYPTNTLVTGYDIIGFWVSRMIFSGLHYTGKAPFNTVLVHGMVRDAQGRKMSKSLDNGIDPLEIIELYGADALRLTLLVGSTLGNDMRFSDEKIKASRNFSNKLWNAARFVLMNLPQDYKADAPNEKMLTLSDKWAISVYNELIEEVSENIERFEFGLAAQKVYDFIWDVLCDWTIEIAKVRLNGQDEQAKNTASQVLIFLLSGALKLMHPFMPFITEEIYRALPGSGESIMVQSWPKREERWNFAAEQEDFAHAVELIRAVRTVRSEMNVHPAKRASFIIETQVPQAFTAAEDEIMRLAGAESVQCTDEYKGDTQGMVQVSTAKARVLIPMMELIDKEKEKARLDKEYADAEKEVKSLSARLSNEDFVKKAPPHVVQDIRDKLSGAQQKAERIRESMSALNG